MSPKRYNFVDVARFGGSGTGRDAMFSTDPALCCVDDAARSAWRVSRRAGIAEDRSPCGAEISL